MCMSYSGHMHYPLSNYTAGRGIVIAAAIQTDLAVHLYNIHKHSTEAAIDQIGYPRDLGFLRKRQTSLVVLKLKGQASKALTIDRRINVTRIFQTCIFSNYISTRNNRSENFIRLKRRDFSLLLFLVKI